MRGQKKSRRQVQDLRQHPDWERLLRALEWGAAHVDRVVEFARRHHIPQKSPTFQVLLDDYEEEFLRFEKRSLRGEDASTSPKKRRAK